MSRLRRNAFANLSGQFIVAAVQVAMIPVYIRYLGVEAYGLVGVYLSLQAFVQLLDFGLSPAVNRQMARLAVLELDATAARDFVRTSETIYLSIGLVLGLTLYTFAPFVATHWFRQVSMTEPVVIHALRMIAVLTAAQWSLTFYQGALLGLNRHVGLNVVRVCATLVSAAGAVIVLARVAPTVDLFFEWQAMIAALQTAAMAGLVWRTLGGTATAARFRLSALRGAIGFAAGMTAVTATSILVTQMDRVVLTRTVPLEQFGYYAIAAVVGTGLTTFVNALFSTMFPLFSRLAALENAAELRRQYVRMWGLMTALTVPFAAVIIGFRTEVLQLWTGNAETARIAAPLAAWLVAGATLNGLMVVVYAMQLAHGATGLALRLNLFLCAVAAPGLVLLTSSYGVLGAAVAWPALNLAYVLAGIPATARVIPAASVGSWMTRAVFGPAAACAVAIVALRLALPLASSAAPLLLQLGGIWIVGLIALLMTNRDLFRDLSVIVSELTSWRGARPIGAGAPGTGGA